MAAWVRAHTHAPLSDLITEMESVTIEVLLDGYVMGEVVPPIVFLFNARYGALRHWAIRTVEKARRELQGAARVSAHGSSTHLDLEEPDAATERVQQALRVVEDGSTLSALEYRVLRFCLSNARDVNVRMTDYLHQHLARVLGIPRKDVSRIYGIAYRKLIDVVGLRPKYLQERGIDPPKRRTNRTRPLTADEVIAALKLLRGARSKATMLDIAWALGVTDVTLYQIRRRFGEMHPGAIRARLQR